MTPAMFVGLALSIATVITAAAIAPRCIDVAQVTIGHVMKLGGC